LLRKQGLTPVSSVVVARAWLPPLLLALHALAFAWRALGGGLLVGDDHPGQLYRLAHALALGPWPWRLDPGWWAGYAELQYYPPGFAYAGAALSVLSLGGLGLSEIYQVLLWLTFLLPAAGTYALLARVLGSPWLALPGAFLALTLSAGSRSGIEEGMRWGLVAARLGWGLLPLLALCVHRWTERAKAPRGAAALLAAIVITHPAHAPAAVILVVLAAGHGPGPRRRRLTQAALLGLAGAGLAAFWLAPLIAHLDMALPLAWGDASLHALARQILERPLLICLALASAAACWRLRRPAARAAGGRWLALLAPATAVVVAADALAAPPLGVMWLPADRLVDSLLLALILGASLALREIAERFPRLPHWGLAAAAIAGCALLASPGRPEPTLTLWPRTGPGEWPKQASVVAGARLDDLWRALAGAPAGRVLFVRSGVPLDHRPEWWGPHSHITALTPIRAGREILNGTFTHPSPVAGLLYTGSPANRPIELLVERRDGVTLFGRRLEALSPEEFNRLAEPLRVSVVVALDEDEGRLDFLTDNPLFGPPSGIGPFLVFAARAPRPVPARAGPDIWRLPVASGRAGWTPTGLAYSPLWKASAAGQPLGVRRGDLGLLEVQLASPAPPVVELVHAPGRAEWGGLALTGATGFALVRWRRRAARAGRIETIR
jgi:hypothetical protein